MRILVALEDLRTGGAQTFALRLAQAMHVAGHHVHIYSHYAHLANQDLVQQLAPEVPVISYGADAANKDWVLRKVDGLGRRLGIAASLREGEVIKHFREVVQRLRPDIVNSHTIKADYVAAKAVAGTAVPLAITMHGCYELFLHKTDTPEVIEKGKFALQQAEALVYLTEKNLEIFTNPGVRAFDSLLHRKIYNGFDGQLSELSQRARSVLGIPNAALVFGMVARGIREKGWHHAINSFLELEGRYQELHLVLVGESDYLSKLKDKHPHPRLHFTGFASNPVDWVNAFDVGLLPSFFHAESLPNSIAEYLSCGKPVIASRIGEVPAMLESPDGPAGVILDQSNWQLTDPLQLTAAMQVYISQPTLLAEHQKRAALAFEKFRMKHCLAAYEALFQQATHS